MAQRRIAHLVGIEETTDTEALAELDRYGLGSARGLAEYQEFSGVDFARKTISARAKRGEVGPDPAPAPAATPVPALVAVVAAPVASLARRFAPVLRTEGAIVIDDFLPEEYYRELFEFAAEARYQYSHPQGTPRRISELGSGCPLRGEKDLIVHAAHATKREGSFHYPSGTPLDRFVEAVEGVLPDIGALVGHPEGWHHFSVTSWIYPPNAALALRAAGAHSGTYVYCLNPEWKTHWGGLLVVLDDPANPVLAAEHGLGRCILPKKNRIVFLAPDAQHLVTRVLPEAGDNVRMSLEGFFHRRAPTSPAR